jgi:hypothetical protein
VGIMTGLGVICSRRSRRIPQRPTPCRWPHCGKTASQAGWGCRPHFFKLTPDLRNRLFLAHRAELQANGRLGQAWSAVADEADLWAADRVGRRIVDRRQGELLI